MSLLTRTEEEMRCLRCQGLMIEVFMQERSSADAVAGWRCLICGEAIDAGIEANRMGHSHPVRTRARVPGTPPVRSIRARP
jgi:hypothetical protein